MLKLRGKVEVLNDTRAQPLIVPLTCRISTPKPLQGNLALLVKTPQELQAVANSAHDIGFAAYLVLESAEVGVDDSADLPAALRGLSNLYRLARDFDYLQAQDVVRLNPANSSVSALFRKNASSNSILLTERCNHLCLMCSQPPKDVQDGWLLEEARTLLPLIPKDTPNLGFTGGEPTLYGQAFIDLIDLAKRELPDTAIDVLSNGRSFKDVAFAKALGAVGHPNLQIGIPIYSDDPATHDYIVQSAGAFGETIQGILNLKRAGVRVEIRFVIHKQSLPRMIQTCEFIARNLLFVDHVALMGLEITGFTRANLPLLWVDPYEYKDQLSEAISVLRSYGMHCSVYNHQLCLVNEDVLPVYRKSISDWKNESIEACAKCTKRSECGGFFSTQVQYKRSAHITPFLA